MNVCMTRVWQAGHLRRLPRWKYASRDVTWPGPLDVLRLWNPPPGRYPEPPRLPYLLRMPAQTRRITLAIAALALAAGALAIWLFPRALPTVAVEQRMTRSLALQRADSFFHARAMQPPGARTALQFTAGDRKSTRLNSS